eukprot:1164435_1
MMAPTWTVYLESLLLTSWFCTIHSLSNGLYYITNEWSNMALDCTDRHEVRQVASITSSAQVFQISNLNDPYEGSPRYQVKCTNWADHCWDYRGVNGYIGDESCSKTNGDQKYMFDSRGGYQNSYEIRGAYAYWLEMSGTTTSSVLKTSKIRSDSSKQFFTVISATQAPTPSPTPSPTPPPTQKPTSHPTNMPTASPTSDPTIVPTQAPTQQPSPKPTVHLTNNPTTKPPTNVPSIAPTVYPSIMPTVKPIIDPTNSPTIVPTTNPTPMQSSWVFVLTIVCGSIILCACIVMTIVLISNEKKHKQKRIQPELSTDLLTKSLPEHDEALAPTVLTELDHEEAIPIQNAMVILIAIGEYDDNPHDADELLQGGLNNLHGIGQDIHNLHKLFGPKYLNYTICPTYNLNQTLKLHWTLEEIILFMNEKAVFLENNLDQFDGLIVVISGHGMKGYICTSDCKMIEKLAIHRIFSQPHLPLREIPRVFLYDCCDGEWECTERTKAPNSNTSLLTRYQARDIPNPQDVAWGRNEKNPDNRLVQINAANPGFQSKLNTKKGSYMLFEFVERSISNLDNEVSDCIYRIFDDIQQHLAAKGKQLITTTYSDKTRWIKLMPKQQEDEDKKDEKDEVNRDDSDVKLDETVVEMARTNCTIEPKKDEKDEVNRDDSDVKLDETVVEMARTN